MNDFPYSAHGTPPRSRQATGALLDIVHIMKRLVSFSLQPRVQSRRSTIDDSVSVTSKKTSASTSAKHYGASVSRRLSVNSDEDFTVELSTQLSSDTVPIVERSSRSAMLLLLLMERFVCSSVAWHSPRNMFGPEVPSKIKDMRSAFP